MLIRESKSQMVVAIGGGSAIDVAKLAALASRNGGYSRDYEKGVNIQQESLPLIAIPTTSGSGSEATPYSVINSAETGRKFTVTDASLYPKHASRRPKPYPRASASFHTRFRTGRMGPPVGGLPESTRGLPAGFLDRVHLSCPSTKISLRRSLSHRICRLELIWPRPRRSREW